MAKGKYAYEVVPTSVNWCWNVRVHQVGWSGEGFISYGSRARAVRKAMTRIARWERRDERVARLTVEGR